jgi:signal transduction histidine kinase
VEVNSLSDKSTDWAAWDDTYKFIDDKNQAYIKSNLVDQTFMGLKINLIIFLNNNGEFVYSQGYDYKASKKIAVPDSLKNILQKDKTLTMFSDETSLKKGIIVLPEGILEFSSRPIITSEFKGPIKGSFILAKYLDGDVIQQLAQTTKLSLDIKKINEDSLPSEYLNAKNNLLSEGGKYFVDNQNPGTVYGFSVITDISAKPALISKIALERSIYKQGVNVRNYLIVMISIMGASLVTLLLFFLSNQVINRLSKLSLEAAEIGKKGNFEGRVSVKGKDELASVAGSVNSMLSSLEISRDELSKAKASVEKEVEVRTRELKEEQARLVASINSLPMGYILTDINGNVIQINPFAKVTLELADNNSEKLSKRLSDAINLETQFKLCVERDKVIDLPNVPFEDKFLHIFLVPIDLTDEPGKPIGIAMIIEDTTASRLLERSKDEFFALASHELRTPLTAIRGNSSLIKEYFGKEISENKDLSEMIDDVHEGAVRLIEIVNDFLDLSRLEQGKVEFKSEVFDLSNITSEVTRSFEEIAKTKNITVNFLEKDQPIKVVGDADRTRQVLYNLIGNAVKFVRDGGVTISIQKEGNTAKLFVADTGIGISKNNQALLFQKFQQAGEKILTRDSTKGTGVGLYIAKLLAKGMGGDVYLESSEVGKGSEFVFTLTLAEK